MRNAFALLASLPLSLAALITVSIPNTPLLNPSTLPSSTHATLSGHHAKLDAPLTRANAFVFHNVSSGSYLLSVFSKDYAFENLRIDVSRRIVGEGKDERVEESAEAWQTFRGNEWDNKGEKRDGVVAGTVEVRPVGRKDYYQQRQTFSPLSFLKSPMILMGLFSLVLIVGMPYLMDNMDPETKAEFEEMQKNSPMSSASGQASALQNFDLASWMAGATTSSGGGGASQDASSSAEQTSRGGGSGGNSKRK